MFPQVQGASLTPNKCLQYEGTDGTIRRYCDALNSLSTAEVQAVTVTLELWSIGGGIPSSPIMGLADYATVLHKTMQAKNMPPLANQRLYLLHLLVMAKDNRLETLVELCVPNVRQIDPARVRALVRIGAFFSTGKLDEETAEQWMTAVFAEPKSEPHEHRELSIIQPEQLN